MEIRRFLNLNFFIFCVILFPTNADWITDEVQLQESYKELHPVRPFYWEDAHELDSRTLNRVCRNVNDQLEPGNETVDENTYVPINSSEIQTERVLRNARVRFGRGFEEVTLIVCEFAEKIFYLAHADNFNVFRLQRDSMGFYRFKSGMHFVFFILAY